jgi:hypothetical protein
MVGSPSTAIAHAPHLQVAVRIMMIFPFGVGPESITIAPHEHYAPHIVLKSQASGRSCPSDVKQQ